MRILGARPVISLLALVFWLAVIVVFLQVPSYLERFQDQRSINVLAWASLLDSTYFKKFEQATGIRVHITYFERNEELFVKLRSSGGSGYDLVMPSTHTAELLHQEGLLKKLDKTRLKFWDNLYPTLLGHWHDPNNDYTIPYAWMVYGLAVSTCHLPSGPLESSWRIIFDKEYVPGPVAMLEDAREAPMIAALYLFGSAENLDEEKLEQIKQLLERQKEWVAVYTDLRAAQIMASGVAPIVVVASLDIALAMRHNKCIQFLVPQEGSFMDIDSFAMPAATEKEEYVYEFLNYLYTPEILAKYVKKFAIFPTLQGVAVSYENFPFTGPDRELLNRLQFFKSSVPASRFTSLWVSLKA